VLNLLDITSNFHSVTMTIIVSLQIILHMYLVGVFLITSILENSYPAKIFSSYCFQIVAKKMCTCQHVVLHSEREFTSIKFAYFSKIYFHTSFQDPY
jgi:hypothetical protein